MKLNKKTLIFISIIVVIILVLTIILISKKDNIQKFIEKLNKEEETILDEISCRVYDNQTEKLKSLVVISRVNGIQQIEYTNNDGKSIQITCNNKQKVGIDLEVEINKEYSFKIISNEEEKIETIKLDENYIDKYIKITKLKDEEEKSYNEVNIEFDLLKQETSKKQYKINKGPWIDYTDTIQMDLEDIDINKLKNEEYDTTIYVKTTDAGGNILQNSKTIEITKHNDFDLFQSMDVSGKTDLSEYGLGVTSWAGTDSEWRWFQVRAMGGGHYRNYGSFSVAITMNWNYKNITFDSIDTIFQFYIESPYYEYATGTIIINYTDGTSDSNSVSVNRYNENRQFKNTILYPDKNKNIQNIQFLCNGSDSSGDGTWLRVNEVFFKGLQKVNN